MIGTSVYPQLRQVAQVFVTYLRPDTQEDVEEQHPLAFEPHPYYVFCLLRVCLQARRRRWISLQMV